MAHVAEAHDIIDSGIPMPILPSVTPADDAVRGDFRMKVIWAPGLRGGLNEAIDFQLLLERSRLLQPLRQNPKRFRQARIADGGNTLIWPTIGQDPGIKIAAIPIERMARDQHGGACAV